MSIPYSDSPGDPEATPVVRPERPEDAAAVRQVPIEAFAGPTKAALVDASAGNPADPDTKECLTIRRYTGRRRT